MDRRCAANHREFVAAAKGSPNQAFWKAIYKQEGESGGPYTTGWLVRLLPYLKQRDTSRPGRATAGAGITPVEDRPEEPSAGTTARRQPRPLKDGSPTTACRVQLPRCRSSGNTWGRSTTTSSWRVSWRLNRTRPVGQSGLESAGPCDRRPKRLQVLTTTIWMTDEKSVWLQYLQRSANTVIREVGGDHRRGWQSLGNDKNKSGPLIGLLASPFIMAVCAALLVLIYLATIYADFRATP